MALALGVDEQQRVSHKVQLIVSQMSQLNQRSSTSLGNMSHVSDSISHPSLDHPARTSRTANNKIALNYVDEHDEHEHVSVEESQEINDKLLQDSYDDNAEVLNENLLRLKRKNSALLSTKKNAAANVNKSVAEVPLSTQQHDVMELPATLSYNSNNHKESETQKQITTTYTFVSLNNRNNEGNKTAKKKAKDVIEVSSRGVVSDDKQEKNRKSTIVKLEKELDDSLNDFDLAPRSAKKQKISKNKTKEIKNYNSINDSSNETIIVKITKNNKQNTKQTKKNQHSAVENHNLKLLISQSSDEEQNESQNKVDTSDLESNYAIYMPSSDDFM